MKLFPKARTAELVTQHLADEILIYDLQTHRTFCLNSTVAFVWQQASGEMPVTEIAAKLQKKLRAPVEEAVVWYALKTLEEHNLLAGEPALPMELAAFNRRRLIEVLGKSAAVAIPLIFSFTAPPAANAGSLGATARANGQGCTSAAQCASGTCSGGVCCIALGRNCSNSGQCCGSTVCNQGTCQTAGSGGGAGGCVLYDTPITTADGRLLRAAEVEVGEELLGVHCLSGALVAGRVKARQELPAREIYALTAESGDVIQCSPTHPLIRGFGDADGTPIERFDLGDRVLVHDVKTKRIVEAKTVAVERIPLAQPVILFEMDTFEHTFISGGIVSHNKNLPE